MPFRKTGILRQSVRTDLYLQAHIELRKTAWQSFSSASIRWDEIDSWMTDPIYLHVGFRKIFAERSGPSKDGLYPTVTVRQLMWALKMKPLPKTRWETTFDRRDI